MAKTLIDRIYEEMREAEREWNAEEICRTFLHMESSGALAGGLVRSILGTDPRFTEAGSDLWSVRVSREGATPVWTQAFRLYWIESRGTDIADWRLHTRLWISGGSPIFETWELATPEDWLRGRRGEDEIRWVGYQPNLMRRVRVWADRNWATTEGDLEPIDLSRWCAVAWLAENSAKPLAEDLQLPRLAQRWNLGPLEESPGGCLTLLGGLLERVRELCPQSTRETLADSYSEAMEPRPVEWDRLGFESRFWEQLPLGPGVYRFWTQQNELLYVGKSCDLPRRVRSYFQNLPVAHSRREDLIYQIGSIECESVPSELEALVRESQAIREEAPRFNVQIDVHPPNRFPKSWKWPLVYLPKSQDAESVTIVGLSGKDRGGLIRLHLADLIRNVRDTPPPTNSECDEPGTSDSGIPGLMGRDESESTELDRLYRWCCDLLTEPESSSNPGLPAPDADRSTPTPSAGPDSVWVRAAEDSFRFDPPESWLALRYYSRRHDEVSRVEPLSIHDPETLVELLLSLVTTDGDTAPQLITR